MLASILYSLPFAVQPIAPRSRSVDRALLEASAMLGASPWRTFVRITLPLSIEGILAGVVLSFAHTLGEFGVVLMVGGNLPGVTRTISISIYDQVQALSVRRRQPDGARCSWPSRSSCSRRSTRCSAGPGRCAPL